MWELVKGWIGLPSLKTASLAVLIGLLAVASYLGWRWLDGVLTTVETQSQTINILNKSIGSKDQQIISLDTARRSALAEAKSYAGKTEELNAESKLNEQKARKYQKESNELQKKLRDLQNDNECSNYPIPDDVISVQRQSIDDFNTKYSR